MMKKDAESLYWVRFRQFIHYDEKTKEYYYDPELPERAKESFEMWLRENK